MFTTGFGLGMACAEAGPIIHQTVPRMTSGQCPMHPMHPKTNDDTQVVIIEPDNIEDNADKKKVIKIE